MWTEPSIADVSLHEESMRVVGETSYERDSSILPSGPLHKQSVQPVNPYHVLQVRRDATPSEIRRSYRRLALFHHCGRAYTSKAELQRRWQIFVVVSACYETLLDKEARARLDLILKERDEARLTAGLPTGEMFVGGVKVYAKLQSSSTFNTAIEPKKVSLLTKTSTVTAVQKDAVPSLSRLSSNSFSDSSDDESAHKQQEPHEADSSGDDSDYAESGISAFSCVGSGCNSSNVVTADNNQDEFPSLVIPSSSSSNDDSPEKHFTKRETDRLFGGPLSMMMRARRWRPFGDPFEVFEEVFGSQIFPIPSPEDLPVGDWLPVRRSPAHGWNGKSHTDKDGTIVFVTSRILNDRRLTKTEKVYKDALGNKVSHVSVTSEPLQGSSLPGESRGCCGACLMCPSTPEFDDDDDFVRAAPDPANEEQDVLLCGNLSYLYDRIHEGCGITFEEDSKNFDLSHHWNSLWSAQFFPE